MTTRNKLVLLGAMATLVSGLLVGCGIKPGHVDSPNGVEGDYFPRKYPDISTDPAPPESTYVKPTTLQDKE